MLVDVKSKPYYFSFSSGAISVPVVKLIFLSCGLKGCTLKSPADNTTTATTNWGITERVIFSSTHFESTICFELLILQKLSSL